MGLIELVQLGVIGTLVGVVYLGRQIVALDRAQSRRDTEIRADLAELAKMINSFGALDIEREELRGVEAQDLRRRLEAFEARLRVETRETRRILMPSSDPDDEP